MLCPEGTVLCNGLAQAQKALPSADAGALQRVYTFLDHWGIINSEVPQGDLPASELAPAGATFAAPLLGPAKDPSLCARMERQGRK